MPQVRITDNDDRLLKRIAPDVLQGRRLRQRRLSWALREIAKLLGKPKPEKSHEST